MGKPLVIHNSEDSNVDIYVDGFPVVENTSGTTNIFPKWCPKGVKIAYLSNKDNDYFGQTDLFVYDFNDSTSKKLHQVLDMLLHG